MVHSEGYDEEGDTTTDKPYYGSLLVLKLLRKPSQSHQIVSRVDNLHKEQDLCFCAGMGVSLSS